jgi:hypothetical protein
MMVLFDEPVVHAEAAKESFAFDEKVYASQYIVNLEDELKTD